MAARRALLLAGAVLAAAAPRVRGQDAVTLDASLRTATEELGAWYDTVDARSYFFADSHDDLVELPAQDGGGARGSSSTTSAGPRRRRSPRPTGLRTRRRTRDT